MASLINVEYRPFYVITLLAGAILLVSCSTPASQTPTISIPMTNTPPLPTATDAPLPPTPDEFANMPGVWTDQPPMLYPRAAHAVISTEDALFALAGTNEKGLPVTAIEKFENGVWAEEGTLPEAGFNAPAAVYMNGRIYVIGGFKTITNSPLDQVLVYDIAAKTWSNAAPLPEPRGGHAAVVLDGKIHVMGGGNSQRTLEFHSMYDPATDTWTDLAPLPRSEGSPAAAVLDGKIYAIGGRSGSSDFGDVYIYDPATDVWSTGPSIEPRGTAGAVAYCGTIFVFGGESQAQHQVLNSVLMLNLEANAWEPIKPMPTARNYARAVVIGDAVYVVGGSLRTVTSHASPGVATVERFQYDCP
jgi:N-acetylneuraminic acid mutarotase